MTRHQSDIELDEIEFDAGKLLSLRKEIQRMTEQAARLQESIRFRRAQRAIRIEGFTARGIPTGEGQR